jgi:hypothetical protein
MVVIVAVVMSMFAISVSQLSRSWSSTLINDATEKQVLYLVEDTVDQVIYKSSTGDTVRFRHLLLARNLELNM